MYNKAPEEFCYGTVSFIVKLIKIYIYYIYSKETICFLIKKGFNYFSLYSNFNAYKFSMDAQIIQKLTGVKITNKNIVWILFRNHRTPFLEPKSNLLKNAKA
jgi:hypothetical protein